CGSRCCVASQAETTFTVDAPCDGASGRWDQISSPWSSSVTADSAWSSCVERSASLLRERRRLHSRCAMILIRRSICRFILPPATPHIFPPADESSGAHRSQRLRLQKLSQSCDGPQRRLSIDIERDTSLREVLLDELVCEHPV